MKIVVTSKKFKAPPKKTIFPNNCLFLNSGMDCHINQGDCPFSTLNEAKACADYKQGKVKVIELFYTVSTGGNSITFSSAQTALAYVGALLTNE